MTHRGIRLMRSCGIGRWEGPATFILILVVLSGLAALVFAADRLQKNVEWVQAAQTDNMTWLISQLEVDALKFLLATRQAESPDHLAHLRSQYDILFSRAEIIGVSLEREGWFGAEGLRQEWHQLKMRVHGLAAIMDMPDIRLYARIPALTDEAAAQAEAIRSFSVKTLQLLVEDSASRREALQDLLHKFLHLATFLVLMLMVIAVGTIVLLRRLKIRAMQNERIKANIEKAVEASLDAVLVADGCGRIVTFNSAAQSIFGFCREEAFGADLAALVIPERLRSGYPGALPGFNLDPDGPVVNRGRRVLVAQRKDGTEFPVEATIVSDRDARGTTTYFGFFRDISDRIRVEGSLKRARDIAMRSEEVKSRFLAVMSHEMRTPLNGLVAALDIVTETTELSTKQAHFLRIARSCSLSALEQVNDVLELTLLDEGQLQEERSAFDVIGLILEIVEQSRPMAEQRKNSVQLALPTTEVPHIQGYRRLFAQVLFNLLGNAIKFTDSGVVLVSAQFATSTDSTPMLRVEVSDTGIGIAEEKLGRIFDDFETLDGSYSRIRQGTGLGLGIARRAVAFMKGEIGVESCIGKGSTFWFTVPLVFPDPQGPVSPGSRDIGCAATCTAPQGCQILVAEDNLINREVLREMLEHCGHHVTEATNGEDAVALASSTRFDLVLMDISMPMMDGVEASIRIRNGGASATSPIIGLTAHAFPDELARFYASGMEEVIVKPITLAKLQDFLSRRAARTTAQSMVPAGPSLSGAQIFGEVHAVPLIDDTVFGELSELLNPAAHASALDMFDCELVGLAEKLRSDPDAATIAAALHKVSGSAAVLGALRVQKLLGEHDIEAAGQLAALARALDECRDATLQLMRARLAANAA